MTNSYGTMSQIREKDIILKMEGTLSKLVLLMKSLQKQVEFGQKKAMKKVINKGENLIHCLNLNSNRRVVQNSELRTMTLRFNLEFSDYSLAYDE